MLSQFESPQKQILRQGFEGKQLMWQVIPGSTSREMAVRQKEKKPIEEIALSIILLWAPGTQSIWEAMGDNVGCASYSAKEVRELRNLSTNFHQPLVCVLGC